MHTSSKRVPRVRMFVCLHKDSNFPVAAVVRSEASEANEANAKHG